eukprot:m.22517 g.22517  ORF g.22517 m.22517 type:complete len:529 (+) comp5824_c0_seq1:188-1774(+)
MPPAQSQVAAALLILAIVLAQWTSLPPSQGNGNFSDVRRKGMDSYCSSNDGCGVQADRARHSFMHGNEPFPDYNKQGIAAAKRGNLLEAAELFRAALAHTPHRGDCWGNVGLALTNFCTARLEKGDRPSECLGYFREALAAYDVGVLLGNEQSASLKMQSLKIFSKYYPSERCGSDDCPTFARERDAMALEGEQSHIGAVRKLCRSAKDVTVRVSVRETATGLLSAVSMRRVAVILQICGVVVLENVFDPGVTDGIASAFEVELRRRMSSLTAAAAAKASGRPRSKGAGEERDMAERGIRRFEIKLPLGPPYLDVGFVANRMMLSAVKSQLSTKIELDTFSCVVSLPQAPNQDWHSDVAELFPRRAGSLPTPVPPHGIVAIVPLLNAYSAESGPTEFYTGSHGPGPEHGFWIDNVTATPRLRLAAPPGGAVLFDVRLRHRGTRNKSSQPRAIAYLGYMREWAFDRVNFKEPQTRQFDQLPTTALKKLFTRLDRQHYVKFLESLVAESGIANLSEVRSRGNYRQVELEA